MTADPRPAPPGHADRDAQKLDLGTIIYEHMERAGATLMWELADAILAAGFARTPESASGIAGISTRFSEHRGDSPGPLLPDAKDGPALGRVEPASGTAEPVAWQVIGSNGRILVTTDYMEPDVGREECERYAAKYNAEPSRRHSAQPYTVRPLYLHPAPPPSVGDIPSPEPQ